MLAFASFKLKNEIMIFNSYKNCNIIELIAGAQSVLPRCSDAEEQQYKLRLEYVAKSYNETHAPLLINSLVKGEFLNLFLPTVPTFAVRETDVSRHNGGTSGAPLKPHRDDSALRALSSLRGLKGAPEVPPLCRET